MALHEIVICELKRNGSLEVFNFLLNARVRRIEWYIEPGPEKKHWHAMGSGAPDVILFPGVRFRVPIETQVIISLDEFEAIGTGTLFLYV
jgi:hypothetical protein